MATKKRKTPVELIQRIFVGKKIAPNSPDFKDFIFSEIALGLLMMHFAYLFLKILLKFWKIEFLNSQAFFYSEINK